MGDNESDNDNLPSNQGEEVNPNDSDDQNLYDDISEGGWIQWFCQLEGNEFFIEIDEDFISDHTNLFGMGKAIKDSR